MKMQKSVSVSRNAFCNQMDPLGNIRTLVDVASPIDFSRLSIQGIYSCLSKSSCDGLLANTTCCEVVSVISKVNRTSANNSSANKTSVHIFSDVWYL